MTQEIFKWNSPSDHHIHARNRKIQTDVNDTVKLGETKEGKMIYDTSDVMATHSDIKTKMTQRSARKVIEQYTKSCETGSGKIGYEEGQVYDSVSELRQHELKKQKDEIMRIAKQLSQEDGEDDADVDSQEYTVEKRGIKFYSKP